MIKPVDIQDDGNRVSILLQQDKNEVPSDITKIHSFSIYKNLEEKARLLKENKNKIMNRFIRQINPFSEMSSTRLSICALISLPFLCMLMVCVLSFILILQQSNEILDTYINNLQKIKFQHSRNQNNAILIQLNNEIQNIAWHSYTADRLQRKILFFTAEQFNQNLQYDIYNIQETLSDKQILLQVLHEMQTKSPYKSFWQSKDYNDNKDLTEFSLIIIAFQQINSFFIRSILSSTRSESKRRIQIQDIFFGSEYDGIFFSNVLSSSYEEIKLDNNQIINNGNCEYINYQSYDIRTLPWFIQSSKNKYLTIIEPKVYKDECSIPFIASLICLRSSTIYEENKQPFSVMCNSFLLNQLFDYFSGYSVYSDFTIIFDPVSLKVIFHTKDSQFQESLKIKSLYDYDFFESDSDNPNITEKSYSLIDQIQLYYKEMNEEFITSVKQVDQFNTFQNQKIISYMRNKKEYQVILNAVRIASKINYLDEPKGYQKIIVFMFMDVLSKETLISEGIKLQDQFQTIQIIQMSVYTFLMVVVLLRISKSALDKSNLIDIPVIRLTQIIRTIQYQSLLSQQNDNSERSDFIDLENLNEITDYFHSYETKILFESFQSLFNMLRFTTQELYLQNDGMALLNLSNQVKHFEQFKNIRALGICHNNIGNIHFNNQRYVESLQEYQRAIIYSQYELKYYKTTNSDNNSSDKISKNFNFLNSKLVKTSQLQAEIIEVLNNEQSENDYKELHWNLFNRKFNYLKSLIMYIESSTDESKDWFWEDALTIVNELYHISSNFLSSSQSRHLILNYFKHLILNKIPDSQIDQHKQISYNNQEIIQFIFHQYDKEDDDNLNPYSSFKSHQNIMNSQKKSPIQNRSSLLKKKVNQISMNQANFSLNSNENQIYNNSINDHKQSMLHSKIDNHTHQKQGTQYSLLHQSQQIPLFINPSFVNNCLEDEEEKNEKSYNITKFKKEEDFASIQLLEKLADNYKNFKDQSMVSQYTIRGSVFHQNYQSSPESPKKIAPELDQVNILTGEKQGNFQLLLDKNQNNNDYENQIASNHNQPILNISFLQKSSSLNSNMKQKNNSLDNNSSSKERNNSSYYKNSTPLQNGSELIHNNNSNLSSSKTSNNQTIFNQISSSIDKNKQNLKDIVIDNNSNKINLSQSEKLKNNLSDQNRHLKEQQDLLVFTEDAFFVDFISENDQNMYELNNQQKLSPLLNNSKSAMSRDEFFTDDAEQQQKDSHTQKKQNQYLEEQNKMASPLQSPINHIHFFHRNEQHIQPSQLTKNQTYNQLSMNNFISSNKSLNNNKNNHNEIILSEENISEDSGQSNNVNTIQNQINTPYKFNQDYKNKLFNLQQDKQQQYKDQYVISIDLKNKNELFSSDNKSSVQSNVLQHVSENQIELTSPQTIGQITTGRVSPETCFLYDYERKSIANLQRKYKQHQNNTITQNQNSGISNSSANDKGKEMSKKNNKNNSKSKLMFSPPYLKIGSTKDYQQTNRLITYLTEQNQSEQTAKYEFPPDILCQYTLDMDTDFLLKHEQLTLAAKILTKCLEQSQNFFSQVKYSILCKLQMILNSCSVSSQDLQNMINNFNPNISYKIQFVSSCTTDQAKYESICIVQDVLDCIIYKNEDTFGFIDYKEPLFEQVISLMSKNSLASCKGVINDILQSQLPLNMVASNWGYSEKDKQDANNQNTHFKTGINQADNNKILINNSLQNKNRQLNGINKIRASSQQGDQTLQQAQNQLSLVRQKKNTNEKKSQIELKSPSSKQPFRRRQSKKWQQTVVLIHNQMLRLPLHGYSQNLILNEFGDNSKGARKSLKETQISINNPIRSSQTLQIPKNYNSSKRTSFSACQNQKHQLSPYIQRASIFTRQNEFTDNFSKCKIIFHDFYFFNFQTIIQSKLNQLLIHHKILEIGPKLNKDKQNLDTEIFSFASNKTNKFQKQQKKLEKDIFKKYFNSNLQFHLGVRKALLNFFELKYHSAIYHKFLNKEQLKEQKQREQQYSNFYEQFIPNDLQGNKNNKLSTQLPCQRVVQKKYIIYSTDMVGIDKNQLLEELMKVLYLKKLKLLVLLLNEEYSIQEHNAMTDQYYSNQCVIKFFFEGKKLIQYLQNQREKNNTHLFPLIIEHY